MVATVDCSLLVGLYMILKFLQAKDSLADNIPAANPLDGTLPGISFDSLSGLVSFGGILAFLGALWSFYTVLAYIVTIILLILYVYASVKKNLYLGLQTQGLRDMEKLYDEQFSQSPHNNRLQDILNHSTSDNPNDWKLAIIEADIVLDDLLKQRGFIGSSLGERLKSISSGQMQNLNDAWEAHKIRNRIAHDGADFVLTKRIAQETIARYQRVFAEFGIK